MFKSSFIRRILFYFVALSCLFFSSGIVPSPSYAEDPYTRRILTFNVWNLPKLLGVFPRSSYNEARLNKLCELIKKQRIESDRPLDAIFLQEVWTQHGRDILSDCGYHAADRNSATKTGLLILSLYPILNSETASLLNERVWPPYRPEKRSFLKKPGVLLARVNDPSGPRVLINSFLPRSPSTEEVSSLIQFLEKRAPKSFSVNDPEQCPQPDNPLVLAGSFHLDPHSEGEGAERWQQLKDQLKCFRQVPRSSLTTPVTYDPANPFVPRSERPQKQDHVFVGRPYLPVAGSGKVRFSEPVTISHRSFNVWNGYELTKIPSVLSDHYGWEIKYTEGM
jgi:hypothetical protein